MTGKYISAAVGLLSAAVALAGMDGFRVEDTGTAYVFKPFEGMIPRNILEVSLGGEVLNLEELFPQVKDAKEEVVSLKVPDDGSCMVSSEAWRQVKVVKVRRKDRKLLSAISFSPSFDDIGSARKCICPIRFYRVSRRSARM